MRKKEVLKDDGRTGLHVWSEGYAPSVLVTPERAWETSQYEDSS